MRDAVLAALPAVLGAVVGSFLNACIHRMPRGISLNNPRRSFCPHCDKLIPWHENIPVLSWVLLRGRCSGCGSRISPRYVLVEILTAALFAAAWWVHGLPLAPVYWVFLSLLVAATFIDLEHFIIPDEITLGGVALGLAAAVLVPQTMGAESRLQALGLSALGAVAGFAVLWVVVEAGKRVFGTKQHRFHEPEPFAWTRDGDRADLRVGEEILRWEDIFSRKSDELILTCADLSIDGVAGAAGRAVFRYDTLAAGEQTYKLDDLQEVHGSLTELRIPREAMGFGDVKFLAAIGAFLGWQAVLFTVFAGSVAGAAAGVAGIFLARDRAGARIPFGPFLALGAGWWVFGGQSAAAWYFGLFGR